MPKGPLSSAVQCVFTVCFACSFCSQIHVLFCRIDQCLIFCRTNFDCDNLEVFLNSIGGGQGYRGKMERGKENAYSCLVLAGQRSMHERREALQVQSFPTSKGSI